MVLVGLAACTAVGEKRSGPSFTTTTGTTMATSPAQTLESISSRAAHTTTSLLDGRLLVAGGCVTDGCRIATDETFIVSSDAASVRAGPFLSSPRDAHTATLLSDGRVVLIGGYTGEGTDPLASIDIFDPATESIAAAGVLRVGRGGHTASLLPDDRILVAGGWSADGLTATSEIFDPRLGTTVDAPDLPFPLASHDAVTMADGRVLIAGGQTGRRDASAAALLFDPHMPGWNAVGDLGMARFKHAMVLLGDGRVLVVGGTTDDQDLLAVTELFEPVAARFSPGPDLSEPRYKIRGGALLIDDNLVVVAGGGRTVEAIDIDTGATHVLHTFAERGSFATLSELSSGGLLVLGGYDDQIDLRDSLAIIQTGRS